MTDILHKEGENSSPLKNTKSTSDSVAEDSPDEHQVAQDYYASIPSIADIKTDIHVDSEHSTENTQQNGSDAHMNGTSSAITTSSSLNGSMKLRLSSSKLSTSPTGAVSSTDAQDNSIPPPSPRQPSTMIPEKSRRKHQNESTKFNIILVICYNNICYFSV